MVSNAGDAAVVVQQQQQQQQPQPQQQHKTRTYFLGGTSSMITTLFTNPLEVVKTRMQLQGELQARQKYHRAYNNAFHALYRISREEGIRGIQKGLAPAMLYQMTMNGTRLGLYDPIKRSLQKSEFMCERSVITNMLAGATSGMLGACIGSPFFLVKTRLQAFSSAANTAANSFGYQHNYSGVRAAFASILREEGPKGLFRGVEGTVPRVAIGSAVQLATYERSKQFVLESKLFGDGILAHFVSSLITGIMACVFMNPFDVVSTRLYNQKVEGGRGAYYNGFFDCIYKIARHEGVRGFYKGFTAHYMRLGPHTTLTFVIWEQLKLLSEKFD